MTYAGWESFGPSAMAGVGVKDLDTSSASELPKYNDQYDCTCQRAEAKENPAQ